MNLKSFVCLAGLALATATTSFAASTTRWDRWMNDYYKNPQPDQVVRAAFGLTREGYLDQPGATATVVGFFSQVFAANPTRVDTWFRRFEELPVEGQKAMAAALWYSGHPKGDALLRQLAVSSERRADIERLIGTQDVAVTSTPVLSESSMNLHWGAFLANGSDDHVKAILAAIGRGEVGDAARVSLAFNAAQHDRVLDICRAELDRQPNEVRSVLRAVINDAEQAGSPTS